MAVAPAFPALPPGYLSLSAAYQEFQRRHPHFGRNVFVMMPFQGHDATYAAVAHALREHGLEPLRADGRQMSPDLWGNAATYMIGSAYGIAIFSRLRGRAFSLNVAIESGFMLALDRPVLLLADEASATKPVPGDFSGRLYRTFSTASLASIEGTIRDWVERDISFYDFEQRKVVLFVSRGGTCRCAMAKALLSKLLEDRRCTEIVVDAAAVADPHQAWVSRSAVAALEEIGADVWLRRHWPRKLCTYLQGRSDLTIRLTRVPMGRVIAPERVVSDADLFGEPIENPWPDRQDQRSLDNYRRVRDQLLRCLERSLPVIGARVGVAL